VRTPGTRHRFAWLASLPVLLVACSDTGGPLSPPAGEAPAAPPLLLGSISCQVRVSGGEISCGETRPPASLRGYLIVGGQGSLVQLNSSAVAYNPATGAFTFNLTVKNLLGQPLATLNGTTPHAGGVKVIFTDGPTVTGGSGIASVTGDGTGDFDHSGEPYYQYAAAYLGADGILSPGETSVARTWTLNVPNTVASFSYHLYVVAEVPYPNGYVDISPKPANLFAGDTRAFSAVVRTATGAAIPGEVVTWGSSVPGVATVDAGGTVMGITAGNTTLTATSGARSGSVALGVCPQLAVGQVFFPVQGNFCMGGGGAGEEFTITPVNLGSSGGLVIYQFTPTGNVAVTGPPTPNLLPGAGTLRRPAGPRNDEEFHAELLRRSREGVRSLGPGAFTRAAGGARRAIVPGVPALGSHMSLNVSTSFCSPQTMRTATVRAVGTHIILLEDDSNPAGGFSTAQYDSITADFDTLAYPVITGNFGLPSDIDGNGRVLALYTAAVNDLTPAGSGSYIGGFYYSRDLATLASCAGSNQGEMFYMLAPDPGGVHGNVRTTGMVDSLTVTILGHEFQHLINASRRTFAPGGPYPLEQVWLDEGLSHVGEELIYYAATGHTPGQNLGAAEVNASPTQLGRFFQYQESNLGRLNSWTRFPGTSGPFLQVDNLAVRGSAWAFLRYSADRKGGNQAALWNSLNFSPDTGMTNLTHGLGTDPRPWVRDFMVAMYLDDTGAAPLAAYTLPSWNYRSLYGVLNYGAGFGYQLQTAALFSGFARSHNLSYGGGTAYDRLGVPAGSFANIAGTTPSALLQVAVMRTR
jgi:hypothetical protein